MLDDETDASAFLRDGRISAAYINLLFGDAFEHATQDEVDEHPRRRRVVTIEELTEYETARVAACARLDSATSALHQANARLAAAIARFQTAVGTQPDAASRLLHDHAKSEALIRQKQASGELPPPPQPARPRWPCDAARLPYNDHTGRAFVASQMQTGNRRGAFPASFQGRKVAVK
jgi:hypothetical protein